MLRLRTGQRKVRDREQSSMGERPQAGAGLGCPLPQLCGEFYSKYDNIKGKDTEIIPAIRTITQANRVDRFSEHACLVLSMVVFAKCRGVVVLALWRCYEHCTYRVGPTAKNTC